MRAVVLDITRTLSRLDGKVLTGVDRVERAYLTQFASGSRPFMAFGILGKTAFVFSPDQIDELLLLIDRAKPGGGSLRRPMSRWQLQKINTFKLPKQSLMKWVYSRLGEDTFVLNVGHLFHNLPLYCERPKSCKLLVMIHDTIPLDFPHFQMPESVKKFNVGLKYISSEADVVICNSNATKDRAVNWLSTVGRTPTLATIPLGVAHPFPNEPSPTTHPFFVQLGTIEPRKNHILMLDVWQRLWEKSGSSAPHLYIVGRRGWKNENVFKRLDSENFMNKIVFERNNLSDAETQKLISGASALLFPSFAEGFGYPLFEARQLGIPIIASNLEVFREFDDPQTLYIDGYQTHTWQNKIEKQAILGKSEFLPVRDINACNVPRWSDHFDKLEGIFGNLGRD